MHYFIVFVIISECVKCFNNVFVSSWLFVILILMYAFIVHLLSFLFLDCQADFDVDNVQSRELVNFYVV